MGGFCSKRSTVDKSPSESTTHVNGFRDPELKLHHSGMEMQTNLTPPMRVTMEKRFLEHPSSFSSERMMPASTSIPTGTEDPQESRSCLQKSRSIKSNQAASTKIGTTKALQEKGVHIWDGNASREYLDSIGLADREEGDLGPVYGFQWRHFGAEYTNMHADYIGKGFDQLLDVVDKIKNNSEDRRIILSAWNPLDLKKMALPPCHMFAQEFIAEVEVRGAHNVLEACAQTETIEKVVFTSLVTAVVWKENHKFESEFDERDWSEPNFCRKFKVLEHASVCLTRIAEAFASSPEKLDELCNHGLVAQAAGLISINNSRGHASLSTSTYTGLIRLLSTCSSDSPLGDKTLLLGISGILKDVLSGSGIVASVSVSPALTCPA